MSSVAIIAMDEKVVKNVINARKAIKRKFDKLPQDIPLEKHFYKGNSNRYPIRSRNYSKL